MMMMKMNELIIVTTNPNTTQNKSYNKNQILIHQYRAILTVRISQYTDNTKDEYELGVAHGYTNIFMHDRTTTDTGTE